MVVECNVIITSLTISITTGPSCRLHHPGAPPELAVVVVRVADSLADALLNPGGAVGPLAPLPVEVANVGPGYGGASVLACQSQ